MAFMKNALLVCITAVLVVYVPSLWTKTPPTLTAGTVQPGFEPVLKVFRSVVSPLPALLRVSKGSPAIIQSQNRTHVWGDFAWVFSFV